MNEGRMSLTAIRELNRGGREPAGADVRAGALLAEGRVEVIVRTQRLLELEAVGSTGARYQVTGDVGGWRCTCPAWFHRYTCVHVDAAKLIVVALPGYRRLPPAATARPQQILAKLNGEQVR